MRTSHVISKRELHRLIGEARAAAKDGGKEICGLLVENSYFLELIGCKNKSRRPGSFAFYYDEVRSIVAAAKRLGHEAVGTFHSHPLSHPEPGERDLSNAPDDSLMLIIDGVASEAALWRIKNGKARKLSFAQF
jgi:proteasome lid subunit RPN8/RPN11